MIDELTLPMPDVAPITNLTCIIGESDPFMAQLLQRFAEKRGFRIQLARTGYDVLDLAKRGPAVVILDPELPGKMRGWEAVEALRADKQTQDIPLIICSWRNKNEALAQTGKGSAYLKKPDFGYDDFAAALSAAGVK